MSYEIEKAIEILTQEWEKSVGDYRYQNPTKLDREYALDIAVQALREKLNLTPPQPLTLEEVRAWTMCKPLFIRLLPPCHNERWEIPLKIVQHWERLICVGANVYFVNQYGKTWLAYPTEPGREDEG